MTPEDVYTAIDRLTSFILRYAITLAAISALSMALIETFKALFSWRDRFHKRWVRHWIQSVDVPPDAFTKIDRPPLTNYSDFHNRVYSQLIRLTTGEAVSPSAMDKDIEWTPWVVSPDNALFALELEKMMGQIQDAADTALGHPDIAPELYLFLSAAASPDNDDHINWFEWAQQPPASTATDPALAKKQADTYARLRQLIRRRLDAFQLTTGYRWQTGNQVVSVLLGAAALFGFLVYLARTNLPQDPLGWVILIVVSLAGGIMAPVAKDLVIALKRVRSGG
jgi:hypothetical protein